MPKKFYAVRKGRKTGIFTTWDECRAQVHGFPCAEYKSFPTMEGAKGFMAMSLPRFCLAISFAGSGQAWQ